LSDSATDKVVQPGSTIGIFGSGQLGKMMAVVAKQMGYRVHVFSPENDTPAGQVADLEIVSAYEDLDAVEKFAQGVDVITLEFENIPVAALAAAAKFVDVFPGNRALEIPQHRSKEKNFVRDNGISTCEFEIVRSLDELKQACMSIMPGVLKTVTGGYDGKGQFVIRSTEDIETAWAELKTDEAILEELIEFQYEFSVIGARSSNGRFAAFPAFRNDHRNQILDVSVSPAGLSDELESKAGAVVELVMQELGAVGVLCVEFFYRDGEILVNEIAPRPHNSGHLTIEGHTTSQFEQHIRAVCGLPLGCTQQIKPAAMANLLGDVWDDGEPRWAAALAFAGTELHLYGKHEPARARKMGHVTTLAATVEQAKQIALEARSALQAPTH
jgi:5-(carboxyamino)imidazole ribonucleotide synthase